MGYKIRDWRPKSNIASTIRDDYNAYRFIRSMRSETRDPYAIPKELLPAVNFRFRAYFTGTLSGQLGAGYDASSWYLLCIGAGDLIFDGPIPTRRFSREYHRFIFKVKFTPDIGIPFVDLSAAFTGNFSNAVSYTIKNVIPSVTDFYQVVYDPRITEDSPYIDNSVLSFPYNYVLGRIPDGYLMGVLDLDRDCGVKSQTGDQFGINVEFFSYIPILLPSTNQGYPVEKAEYVDRDGRKSISFSSDRKITHFKIPSGAKIKLFFLKHSTGFSAKDDFYLAIRTLPGGLNRSVIVNDSVTGESFSVFKDTEENLRLNYSKSFGEYEFDRKVAISGSHPTAGAEPALVDLNNGKKVLIYEKTGGPGSEDEKRNYPEGVTPPDDYEGSNEPGIWACMVSSVGDQGGKVKFDKITGTRKIKEMLLVPNGKHHVVIEDKASDSLWVFYWLDSRLKYPDQKRKQIQEILGEKQKKKNRQEQNGYNVYTPKKTPPVENHNFVLLTSEVELDDKGKPKKVEKGSLYLKRLSISCTELFNPVAKEAQGNANQSRSEAQEDPPAEDYLILPIPRDDTFDLPEQVVGVEMTDSGFFTLTYVDEDEIMHYCKVQVKEKEVNLISVKQEKT